MTATDVNATWVQRFLDPLATGAGWTAACVRSLREATEGDNVFEVTHGFVTKYREKSVWFAENGTSNAWGIDLKTCAQFCSRAQFPMQFNFPLFGSGVTNYLLPWLGLCAQLPYETDSHFNNFMSFSVAVGSPMLITFSLAITSFNSHATETRFKDMLKSNADRQHYKSCIDNACYFLRASQQAPLRVDDYELSELMARRPTKQLVYWQSLAKKLRKTERPVTFSLIAQTLFAIIAWILTIAASYITSLGQPSQALLLSSGTLWVWLVPVVLGWVFVGTQATSGTIEDAIESLPLGQPKAFEVRSGFDDRTKKVPDVLLGSVLGDENIPGPSFNYARIFTYYKLLEIVAHRFELVAGSATRNSVDPVIDGIPIDDIDTQRGLAQGRHSATKTSDDRELRPVSSRGTSRTRANVESAQEELSTSPRQDMPSPSLSRPNTPDIPHQTSDHRNVSNRQQLLAIPNHSSHRRTNSSSSLLDARGQQRTSEEATASPRPDYGTSPHPRVSTDSLPGRYVYVKRSDLNSTWWRNFLSANALAFCLHWGTAGAAVVISYLTEVRGLGCRSGSYFLYGIVGTAVHVLLLGSVCLSHKAMLLHQETAPADVTSGIADSQQPSSFYATLAVLTRIIGKVLAISNALWLILSSVFELIGFYDSCWCTGTVLELGERGWVILFVSAEEMRREAEAPWAGGIALSIMIACLAFIIIWRWSTTKSPS